MPCSRCRVTKYNKTTKLDFPSACRLSVFARVVVGGGPGGGPRYPHKNTTHTTITCSVFCCWRHLPLHFLFYRCIAFSVFLLYRVLSANGDIGRGVPRLPSWRSLPLTSCVI